MPLRVDPDHPCLWSQALMLSCVSTRVMWRSQQLQLLKICKELHSFCFVETRTWNDVQWDLCNQEWRCITAMLVITDNGGRWLDNCTRKVEDDWVGTVKLKPPRGIICIHLCSHSRHIQESKLLPPKKYLWDNSLLIYEILPSFSLPSQNKEIQHQPFFQAVLTK